MFLKNKFMKKVLLIAVFIICGLWSVNAQENVVKVNPIAVLGGTDLVSYERVIGDQSSAVISGAIGGFKFGGVDYSSFGVGAQYRYYFSEVLKGWYGAGDAAFQSGDVEVEDLFGSSSSSSKTDFSAFRVGAKAGYQWIWNSDFSLDLNFGIAYSSFNYDDNDDNSSFSILKASGVLPTFGFGLGYAW